MDTTDHLSHVGEETEQPLCEIAKIYMQWHATHDRSGHQSTTSDNPELGDLRAWCSPEEIEEIALENQGFKLYLLNYYPSYLLKHYLSVYTRIFRQKFAEAFSLPPSPETPHSESLL